MAHMHAYPAHSIGSATKRLAAALIVTLAFVVIEAAAGLWANSLALLTDAAHNITDVMALGLSWYALRLTLRPATPGRTYGYHRVGILVALVNSTTLAVIAIGIFYEAYQRLIAPPAVKEDILVGVGLIAVVINVLTAWLVHRDSDQDLNLRSAFVHLMGDVLSTVGAVLAGIGIALTGWQWLDPFASILIGLLILWNAWGIVRESVEILLEGTPHDVDMDAMVDDLLAVKGVQGVHDLHVWSISQNFRSLSAHILTDDVTISSGARTQRSVNRLLMDKYDIRHATLQLECANCEPDLLYCDLTTNSYGDHGPSEHPSLHEAIK